VGEWGDVENRECETVELILCTVHNSESIKNSNSLKVDGNEKRGGSGRRQ
jgi:hypothetical protein